MRRTLTHLFTSANAGNGPYRMLPAFVASILVVGSLRFALSVNGVADSLARYASMTGVILIAVVYFAFKAIRAKERLIIAYVLVAPYLFVEAAGLGFTWWTDTPTIFHVAPYTLGTSIRTHFWGHVIGGLTWEPLVVFAMITAFGRALGKKPRGHSTRTS